MTCVCLDKIQALANQLTALAPAALSVPPTLGQLGPMMGGLATAGTPRSASQLAAQGRLAAALPAVPVEPLQLAQMQSLSMTATSVQGATGVHLASPQANVQLAPFLTSLGSNASALAPLAKVNLSPWMALSALASLVRQLTNLFGLNPLAAKPNGKLVAELNAALSARASLAPVAAPPPNLVAYATLQSTATSMNVNLAQPGAVANLNTGLATTAALKVPAMKLNPLALMNALGLLSALDNIHKGLGVSPTSPNFPTQIAALQPALGSLQGIQIPASLSASASAGTAAAPAMPALKADLKALSSLNLAGLQVPKPAVGMDQVAVSSQVVSLGGLGSTSACGGCAVL